MKEPLKEVPNELIEELNAYDSENLAHHPVAEALRDLIEDWKRLKESNETMSQDIAAVESNYESLQEKLLEIKIKLSDILEDNNVKTNSSS